MFDTVTSAEGGGWGAKASASVGAMMSSGTSANTLTYTIGGSKTLFRKTIRNPNMLKLTQAAKGLLYNDPMGFLEQYGAHYVSEIEYGGSFLGVIDIYGKSSSEKNSLDVYAGIDANDVYYNAKVSEDFKMKTGKESKYINVKSSM